MQTIICDHYGSPEVLHLSQAPQPTPKADEILVQVYAVAVTAADSRIRGGRFPSGFGIIARLIFGIRGPRQQVLGSCFSGKVVAIGQTVTNFSVGDEVFGINGLRMGAYAEFLTIGQNQAVVKKPATVSHPDAAGLVFGGMTAVYFLHDQATLRDHSAVLVNGAAGSVGSSVVQIARSRQAKVTAVCSAKSKDFVTSLGADAVVDYNKEDIRSHKDQYDLVVDCVGNLTPQEVEKILAPNGTALLLVAGVPQMFTAAAVSARSKKRGTLITGSATETKAQLQLLLELYAEKKLRSAVSKVFPFSEFVEAHRLVDSNHKVGNIVLQLHPKIDKVRTLF